MFYKDYLKKSDYLIRKNLHCFIFKDPILCNTLSEKTLIQIIYLA